MNLPVPAQPSAKPSLNLRGSARLLTVFAFSLFLLINTSVTRVVLRGSLLLFFSHSLLEDRHTCSVGRCSSHLCWDGKKKLKRGGGEKIPETGPAGMWDWSDLSRNVGNALNANTHIHAQVWLNLLGFAHSDHFDLGLKFSLSLLLFLTSIYIFFSSSSKWGNKTSQRCCQVH